MDFPRQPKERRKRFAAHDSSVKLAKRQFAVEDNAVEHIEVGGAMEASVCQTFTFIYMKSLAYLHIEPNV